MNLRNKKKLMARVLKVGANKIRLNSGMKEEIKEAITRQDMRDLMKEKIISLREGKGRKSKIKSSGRRGFGSVKRHKKGRYYVKITRKLRNYLKSLREKNKIGREEYHVLRKKIKAGIFKDLNHLRQETK